MKKFVFWTILIAVALVIFEVAASVAMLYRYRLTNGDIPIFQDEPTYLSSVNLVYKAARRVGLVEKNYLTGYRYYRKSIPHVEDTYDALYGYSLPPGLYTNIYQRSRLPDGEWELFKTRNTINEDGSRWTGTGLNGSLSHKILVFGDSFVYGAGVNDEQTFSYHLQQAFPNKNIKLYALGGYSLTQSYLRFNTIKNQITADDIIILGYADFYDKRHVADPERLRETRQWRKKHKPEALNKKSIMPRAQLSQGGEISIDYIEVNCQFNNGYCEQASFSDEVKTKTTSALINAIARNTLAKVYLLHFNGTKNNPVRTMLDERVELISALPEDFDSFIRDNVEGFDYHPGPYWHYAIARKIIEKLNTE